ncbi:hypothetical protein CBR_g17061 [Chara braunii]|uniref:Uncharacterized protein n=1 Tax=Chara braunii TaxID=69332 RepID=A0A388KUI3_CHABU|nr:hypothetical protein CBR_g17061 [Chara braunii]|eukprot:GBG73720.1 hypothetical protein CBR_g17061 [Chara braunii]
MRCRHRPVGYMVKKVYPEVEGARVEDGQVTKQLRLLAQYEITAQWGAAKEKLNQVHTRGDANRIISQFCEDWLGGKRDGWVARYCSLRHNYDPTFSVPQTNEITKGRPADGSPLSVLCLQWGPGKEGETSRWQPFVPVSKDKQRAAELKFCGFKWITKGQTLPSSNGNFLMECKLCGEGFQGSQTKAAAHFTIKNNCPKVFVEQLAEIWNKTNYTFDQSHCQKILDFLKSRGYRDIRCTSGREQAGEEEEDSEDERRGAEGRADDDDSDMPTMDVRREVDRARGKMKGEKAVDEDNIPGEDYDDDEDTDIGASYDGGLMTGARSGQEGAARAMMEARGLQRHPLWLLSDIAKDDTNGKIGKREDTIIRARAVVRFIREHRAALSLYRWYSVAQPSSASAIAASSSATPPQTQRRGKELVYLAPMNPPWSITFFGAARWSEHDKTLAEEALRYLRQQTGDDEDLYHTLRTQLAESHSREGDWTYGRVEGDKDATSCRGEKETSQISTNLRLSCRQGRGSGYVLPWEDDEETEDVIPLPRDEGVRPADLVTEAQREWQVQRGQRDRLSRAPPNVETYFDRRPTVEGTSRAVGEMLRREKTTTTTMSGGGTRAAMRTMMIPTIPRHADVVMTTTTAATVHNLQVVYRGPRDTLVTDAVVQAGEAAGQVAAASAEVAASPAQFAEVAVGSAEVVAASAEVAEGSAEVAAASAEAVAASAETAVGSPEVDGVAAEVGRASAQFGASFNDDMFGASLGLPPTPAAAAGERGSGGVDAQATPISQILRGFPSCIMGDISSSMLREVAEETHGSLGQHEHVVGDDGGCRPVQERVPESEKERADREERERALELARHCEMTQSIAVRARAEQMLETGDGAGHCTAEDAEVECDGAVGGDADERPASPVHGVCVFPFTGALSAEELERQAREDPLRADRRGLMDEASRRVMVEGPAYVPCSPSVRSSTTYVILPTHAEGPGPTLSPASAPARESPSPKSWKKKMRVGKGLSTARRVTHEMRASQPGLVGLHPRTREALGGDVVADAVGWREGVSTRGTEQPMSAPAEAAVPRPGGRTSTTAMEEHDEHSHTPGRSMAGRILGLDVRALTTLRS